MLLLLSTHRRSDLSDPSGRAGLVRQIATELVKRQPLALNVDDRNRIVEWMIGDPYLSRQISAYLERGLP